MTDSEGTWQPAWTRGGKIHEVAWIGKDILAWSSGLHLIFFHVSQKRESLRWCPKAENADGICCLSGHPTMQLLAFSDKTLVNPKIRVLSYPSMRKLSDCVGGSKTGYFATAFTSWDHLISLAVHPTHSLTIWSWRTGERLASIETLIRDTEGQMIRVNHGRPTLIAQLGRPSGKLHIWEVSPAGKTLILTNHEVALPNEALGHHMDWSPGSGANVLAIVDRMGHVYLSNEDASSVHRVVLTRSCGICTEYEAPAVSWFRGGIVLKTTFCQIRFYRDIEKKDATITWRKEWYVKSILKPSILIAHPTTRDRLFCLTQEGFLLELEIIEGQDEPAMERIMHHGGIYSFADMIRPWGHHLLAMDDPVEAVVLDCYDGRQVGRLHLGLEGEVTQLLSHPDLPVVAVTSKEGELAILSLVAPESPFVIAKFHLQKERLDLIKFSESGKNLIVGQRTTGICYCVGLTTKKPFAVTARVETKSRMADVVFYDDERHPKLLVLVVSSRRVPVGHHLAVYDLHPGQSGNVEPTNCLELPCAYQFLHYAPRSPRSLIATVYLTRQIHLLEIRDWKHVNLREATASGHRTRRAKISTDRRWVTCATFDGLVTVRRGDSLEVVTTVTTHHRRDFGAVKAFAQPSGAVIVALGHDGSLVAMKFLRQDDLKSPDDPANCCRLEFDEYARRKREIMDDYASLERGVLEMLSRKVAGFPAVETAMEIKRTWVEAKEESRLLEEAERCSHQKMAIQADFVGLQRKIGKLLDDNETCPAIERLPISAFDLDKVARDQRLKTARDEVEDRQLELEHNCLMMDRLAGWIRATFWDSQEIVGQSIFPIFGNDEVTNFSVITDTPDVEEMLQLARLHWDPDENEAEDEPASPSKSSLTTKPQTPHKQPKFSSVDERQRFDALLDDDEEDHEVDPDEIEDQLAKEGTTTHRFIEPSNRYCSQFEVSTLSQLLQDNRNIRIDCQRLRDHFNRLFLEMYESKEREVRLIHERNQRIRHLDSELRLMFSVSVPETPVDPAWNIRELPNSVIRVLDHEINAEPYISDSKRESLNRRAAEAERLRQLMLADDFREKALMRMMDGVLEIRWEDVIKRDVPKPRCMLTKDPDDYGAEDILAVRQYEEDVANLQLERLRYRRLLEAEFAKISGAIREGVERFDARLRDFSVLRMRLEAAVHQLNLRNLRGWLRHMCRMRAKREDHEIREMIGKKRETLARLRDEVRMLQGVAREYKILHEAAVARERTTEKKFRAEFPMFRRIVVEMLEKEYKRRPRVALKNATSGDLVELGRTAASTEIKGISRGKISHLPHECLDYLRHLETLDVRPTALPTTVEVHHWDHLTRMRRTKIDQEMRLRAQMAEIHETERTIAEHSEKIARCQADVDQLVDRTNDMLRERMNFEVDVEIQLVLRMGQVEVAPQGRRDQDTANAVFIPRFQIDAVNETVIRAGGRKLSAMDRTISFRRGLLFKEWEHKCRRTMIAELAEELGMIENLLVTRDVREYLKRDAKGLKDDKTPQQLQRELEAMRRSCVKRLGEWSLRLEDVENKVVRVKRENQTMDRKIEEMNVDRWELEWQRDPDGQAKQREYQERRMNVVARRAKLVRTLQKEYMEVLAMQTEHELLRLRRYPTLSCFKTLDDETRGRNVG